MNLGAQLQCSDSPRRTRQALLHTRVANSDGQSLHTEVTRHSSVILDEFHMQLAFFDTVLFTLDSPLSPGVLLKAVHDHMIGGCRKNPQTKKRF